MMRGVCRDKDQHVSRETWALQEWLLGDYDLLQTGRAVAAGDGDLDDAAGWVQEWVEQEVWWEKVKTHNGRIMILDIGSIWRIDWHVITKTLREAPDPLRT
jgi:hypothetical protein